MRLIDADALKKTLCEEYEAREHYIGEKMLEAIDNAPTISAMDIAVVGYEAAKKVNITANDEEDKALRSLISKIEKMCYGEEE